MSSEDGAKVVIIGSGKLGLGLLARQCASAGIRPIIAGRKKGSPSEVFDTLSATSFFMCGELGDELLNYEIAGTIDVSQDYSEVVELLARTPNVVVMSSVGLGGQPEVARCVRDSVTQRKLDNTDGQLVFIPCENEVVSEISSLRDIGSSGFVMLDTMVDRICPSIRVSGGVVQVFAEREFEWAVSVTEYFHVLQVHASLLQRVGIDIVSDLDAVRIRKKLMMNGVQLACALLAAASGATYLQEYIEINPRRIAQLLDEMVKALTVSPNDYNREDLVALADWYERRIVNSARSVGGEPGDSVARMTRKATATEIDQFLIDLKSRLGVPYAWIARSLGIKVARKTQIGYALRLAFESLADLV